jgi:hypothetical protein
MIVYTLNILLCTILIITPYLLLIFIFFNFRFIQQEEFLKTWGTFFEEFRILNSKVHRVYYVLFFMRRLFIAVALIAFREFPLVQGIICVTSCLSILIYIAMFRPYKAKIMNYIQIINELSILAAYMLSSMFYFETGLDMMTHSWAILSCVYLSYIIHLVVLTQTLAKLVINILNKYKIIERIQILLGKYTVRSTTHV